MNNKTFAPGFRLSTLDVIVLILGAVGAISVCQFAVPLGIAIAFTVGHFFLFCNVLRMPRRLELTWAALYVSLAASAIIYDTPTWPQAFALTLMGTAVVAAIQLRSAAYHGIGWQRINPDLPQWWAQREGNKGN